MKIFYVCFGGVVTPGMQYKENCMARVQQADGNSVTIVAGTETWENGELTHVSPGTTTLENGVTLVRFSLDDFPLPRLNQKIRYVKGFLPWLVAQQPDIIVFHILQQYAVSKLGWLRKQLPYCKIYGDCSTTFENSARGFLSNRILHRIIYRNWLKKSLPYWDKIFYVVEETREFLQTMYGIPDDLLEFQSLGGVILPDDEYLETRTRRRMELGIGENDRLYLHSGKLDALKRTDELLRAFSAVEDPHAMLAVIGSIPEEQKHILLPLIEADKRIKYLGWKSGADLQEYLCACDLYCQPGSQSATMQNAMCCRCPVMLYPHPSHKNYDWGSILWVETQTDMEDSFRSLAADPGQLAPMKQRSQACAEALLDYHKLAARLYR